MQLKTITHAKDAPFGGVEFVKTDKHITEVVIGGKLRIRTGESYNNSLKVLVEQPHEEVERHRVTAKIDGFDDKVVYFDTAYEANNSAAEFEGKGATATVEKVTALINDAGEVVGIKGDAEASDCSSDVPF